MQIKTVFSKKEHSDSGLALLMVMLVIGMWLRQDIAIKAAIAVVLILLVAPVLIYPFTFLWLNISVMLGRIMSKILLTLIFFVFVVPVSLIRRGMGKDTLKLKKFKKGNDSMYSERNYTFTKADFSTPY